ncbi:MAG TPA: hypothetical protein VKY65_21760 [Alphaproteobacteria bacterium]|nr:hypothetical protein [Alphaproteobacteria bacterium]
MGVVLLSGCDAQRFFAQPAGHAAGYQMHARAEGSRHGIRTLDKANLPIPEPPPESGASSSNSLIGLDEDQLAALFGPPTSQQDQAPGKTWKYRSGKCTLDVSLYPDVQTHVYHTLSYEVSSDDNSAEGKRLCLVELQSLAHSK